MGKPVYFSQIQDPTKWEPSLDYATFVLIPRRWWSVHAWKETWAIRARLLNLLVKVEQRE